MNGPTNQLGQLVQVGDTVVVTTTSWKSSRTRIARVVRLVQGSEKTRWDTNLRVNVPTGEYNYRVFVRLFQKRRHYDRVTKVLGDVYYHSYVKEIFGIGDSVNIDPNSLPIMIQEVLDGK